jgi:TonB family protein
MTVRIDPLEQHERLRSPLVLSLSCHAVLFVATLAFSLWNAPISLGDPSGQLGQAVSVNITQGIPLPRSRSQLDNPVANPVKHDVPAVPEPPKPEAKAPEEDLEAVPLETKPDPKQAAQRKTPAQARKNPPPTQPNQVGSSTGGRLNSPLLTGQQSQGGTGGVGFGTGSPFGARFGWYADALQRRLAEEWSRALGQVSGSSTRSTIVSFTITQSGAIENPLIVSRSGNNSMDYAALRAVANTNPFRPLPRDIGKRAIQVEITFQVQ